MIILESVKWPVTSIIALLIIICFFGPRLEQINLGPLAAKIAPANVLSTEEKVQRKNQLASLLKINEDYFSKEKMGEETFDYSNNNGIYTIGEGEYRFDTQWTKASDKYIHFYSDLASIKSVRLAKDSSSLKEIYPEKYDPSSRVRTAGINQVAIFENVFGKFLAVKILEINDDTRGDERDALRFEYKILD